MKYILLIFLIFNLRKSQNFMNSIKSILTNESLINAIKDPEILKQILKGFFYNKLSNDCFNILTTINLDFNVFNPEKIVLSILDILSQLDDNLKNTDDIIVKAFNCAKSTKMNPNVTLIGFFSKLLYNKNMMITKMTGPITIFTATLMMSLFTQNYIKIGENLRSLIDKASNLKVYDNNNKDITYIFGNLYFNDFKNCIKNFEDLKNLGLKNYNDFINSLENINKKCIQIKIDQEVINN